MAERAAVNLLLDTAPFLWLCAGAAKLSPTVATALSDPNSTVSISAMSAWEIALQYAKKKLVLPTALESWFPAMIRHHQLQLLPIEAATAIASASLPALHGDPFDRILIATALERRMCVITPDLMIRKYPNLQCLW